MFLYSAAKSYLWGDDPNAPVTIHISWLGKRFLLEFDPTEFPMATVGDLRRECADETLVEPERVRLIHKGTLLKDDRIKLIDAGLRSGATVMMSGSVASTTRPKQQQVHMSAEYRAQQEARRLAQQKQLEEELKLTPGERAFKRIDGIVEGAKKDVLPLFDEYEELVKARPTAANDLNAYEKRCAELHAQCTEYTMQQLLKLDGVSYEVDDSVLQQRDGDGSEVDKAAAVVEAQKVADDVRQERRKAVRLLQGWLEKADVLKARKNAPPSDKEEVSYDESHEEVEQDKSKKRKKKKKHSKT